ncbi:MAG TPA: AI-2E family transporter [Thermomicrobiales bacterium]|nr:AI-2E family transporter [Thermomicrobiales bacterium]
MQTQPVIDAHEFPGGVPDGPRRVPGITPLSLFLVLLVAYLLIKVQLVLILVVLALLFATIIERPVGVLERRHIPRGLSILAVYIVIIGTLTVAGILIAPSIGNEADRFRAEAPSQLEEMQNEWRTSSSPVLRGAGVEALGRAVELIRKPTAPPEEYAIGIATGIGGGIIGAITVLVMAFYYLMEKAFLRRVILEQLHPLKRPRVEQTWDRVEAQVGRWLRGQLTLCLIIGLLSTIGYGLIGVRFWPLLGLFAGITEAIPIVGPWLGGIPAFVIALTDSWQKALMVALFVVALQTTENWVLVPRVMRGAVGLTPLTVLVAILAGTAFMNVIGAFLAIPIAAVVQVLVSDYLRSRREANRLPEPQGTGWRWMRDQIQHEVFHDDPPEHSERRSSEPAAAAGTTAGWTSSALTRVGGRLARSRLTSEVSPVETDETTQAGSKN